MLYKPENCEPAHVSLLPIVLATSECPGETVQLRSLARGIHWSYTQYMVVGYVSDRVV